MKFFHRCAGINIFPQCFSDAPVELYFHLHLVGLPASEYVHLSVSLAPVISTNDSHYVVML